MMILQHIYCTLDLQAMDIRHDRNFILDCIRLDSHRTVSMSSVYIAC